VGAALPLGLQPFPLSGQVVDQLGTLLVRKGIAAAVASARRVSQRPPGLFMSKDVKTTPKVRRPSRYPCIFRGRFIRDQVDPRVKELWERTTGKPAPFGRLRLSFQRGHCQAINPYGSEDCPYREEECAMAFLGTVQNSLLPWVEDPAAYFVKVARSSGVERADNKPLARERHLEKGPSHTRDVRGGHAPGSGGDLAPLGGVHRERDVPAPVLDEEDHLRRAHARPFAIGNLLGSLYPRTREGRPADGSEGSK
jgi:hypothetical protein